MKIQTYLFIVKDKFNNEDAVLTQDFSSNIQIGGLLMELYGGKFTYNDDSKHLKGWCEFHGFEYKCIELEIDSEMIEAMSLYSADNYKVKI